MRFHKRLHDGEAQADPVFFLRIGFKFVEYSLQSVFGNSGSIIGDPALDGTFRFDFTCPDDYLAASGMPDRISNQVLKDTPQQAGICVRGQFVGDVVDEFRAAGTGQGMQIVKSALPRAAINREHDAPI